MLVAVAPSIQHDGWLCGERRSQQNKQVKQKAALQKAPYILRGPPFNLQGGGGRGVARVFVTDKLFISTGLGGALKMLNFIICLYRTVLEVKSLFHAESARNYLFQKRFSLPPPLSIKWWSYFFLLFFYFPTFPTFYRYIPFFPYFFLLLCPNDIL